MIAQQLSWFQPALRSQAKGKRSLGFWDEDAITFAVAAGSRALRTPVDHVVFASTTAPFLDRSNAGLMAEALGLEANISTQDVSGSLRAGTSAMMQLLTSSNPVLLAAADRRTAKPGSSQEMSYGDAGVAFQMGQENCVADYLGGISRQHDMVDHYRAQGQDSDYTLEQRWFRDEGVLKVVPDTITEACTQLDLPISSVDHLITPFPSSFNKKICKQLSVSDSVLAPNLYDVVGDCGVAHSLLMLAHVLDGAEPDSLILAVGFGQGCDVLAFRVNQLIQTHRAKNTVGHSIASQQPLVDYLKLPAFSRMIELDAGLRAEADKRTAMAAYFRRRRSINSMIGSKCEACGTPHFPSARVCVNCGSIDRMSDYHFAEKTCHVKTFTEDFLAASPAPPMIYGNIEFEGGGNAFLEFTDSSPGELNIGDTLYSHFRVKTFDPLRGFRRYFWKPSPVPLQ
ncbi:MAG: hypothetical protein AAF438_04395 [Pseudomonadota bacterium]